MSYLVLHFCLLGNFLNYKFNFTASDWSVQIVCFFLIQFDRLYVSRNVSISLGCPMHWHITVHSISLRFFVSQYLCDIGYYFSSFMSYFVYSSPPTFLLVDCGLRFINFVYLFKKPAIGFIELFYWFFGLCLFPL